MGAVGNTSGGQDMPSILDRELSDLSRDAFGHQHFANALRHLIEGSHRPPFSIGLLGSWGTGKSTIKELYLASLKTDASGPKRKKRRDRFRAITFNAWRYGGDSDIKRALLRHVFLELGGDDVELRRELYQQVNDSGQKRRGFGEWAKEALLQNAATALMFVVLFAAIMLVLWLSIYLSGLSDQWGLSAVLAAGSIVAAFLAKFVVDLRLKSPTLFNNQSVISFPATSAEEYERMLVKQIRQFKKGNDGRACERLVVFVDDLDRLSAAEMVSGLDAVRTFLELPLGDEMADFGAIFVISCDEDRVADALSRGRGRLNPELPGSVFTRWDARRYLDRLFQFRLEIPPFPKLDMRQFTEQKLRESGSIAAEIEKRGVRVQDLVERLIHVGVQSPRNAIQILNAFTQTWWIAVERERSGRGSTAPGALYDGAVTGHPLALAALCVLRVDFPDFYNELQKRPELIREFNRVVFSGEAFDTLALSGQQALKDFLLVQDGKVSNEVKADHRTLRQYLASLLSLRWPRSIQPLLLLAQDAISRKFGDRAAELNDAFVSGDVQGVLEIFGHHLDTDDLGREDVRLVEALAEGLSDDTQARRVNAARVLAAIANRIPTDFRNGLMVPLARQMVDLKDIRTNVGPTAAKAIIASLSPDDRREVAESFSADLLTGERLEWRLPTGETPNLDELIRDVQAAAELVLQVRASDGLPPSTDARLKAWLLEREVQSSEGSQTLSFATLEGWMDEHQHLLPLLADHYTHLAIDELDSEAQALPHVGRMIERARQLYATLADGGQESRELLWRQVTRLVAVRDPDAVKAAWSEAGIRAALATVQQERAFLLAMASRLHQEMSDPSQWKLSRAEGAQQFLDLATRWQLGIDQKTATGILPLARAWGEHDDTAAFMIRVADLMSDKRPEFWNELTGYFAGKPFGDLPWPTLEYLASNLGEIPEASKAALVEQLNALVNADAVDAQVAQKHASFIDTAPEDEWASAPLLGHTKTVRTRVLAMATRPEYLSAVFPSARLLVIRGPKGYAATVLKPLFEQAAGAPDAYPIIHHEMAGYWPEVSEETGSYEPGVIASRAIQFIKENPALPGSGEVFSSIVDIVSRELADQDFHEHVSEAATILWRHSPSVVVKNIGKIASLMTPEDVAKLLAGKRSNDLVESELQTVVYALSDDADEDRCVDIAGALLAVEPRQIGDKPDGALSIWLSSLRGKSEWVLKALVRNDRFNDGQRERILSHVVANRDGLGLEFFVDVMPIILSRTEDAKSLAIAVKAIDGVASLARNNDQKSSLVAAILPTLPTLPHDALHTVARTLKRLGGRGSLERSTDVLDRLDSDQLAILAQEFPDSRIIADRLSKSKT